MAEAAGEGGMPVVFGCSHTATEALSGEGRTSQARYSYVELPCLGALDGLEVLRAFDRGARRVLVVGCLEGRCRHVTGSQRARAVVAHVAVVLGEAGLDKGRLRLVLASPLEPADVERAVRELLVPDGGDAR